MTTVTQEEAHRLFEYRDGVLYWRERPAQSRKAKGNMEAGTDSGNGYRKVSINKKRYYEHRIIFLMHHGFIPEIVDHIDGNTLNNNIDNIRASNKSLNACNSKIPSHNTSGHKGVLWLKREKKWGVRVQFNKRQIHLGSFFDKELACLVADEGRSLYHGKYARL
jgi:hypothetical protein